MTEIKPGDRITVTAVVESAGHDDQHVIVRIGGQPVQVPVPAVRSAALAAGLLADPPPEPVYTAAQVEAALGNAYDLVADGLNLGEAYRDLLILAKHAAAELLADPAVTLDQVIERHYYGTPPEIVRGWWDSWS